MEADLTTELGVLQEHLDGMLNRVQQNSTTFKRLQQFETSLLGFNKLPDLIDYILEQTESLFELDIVTLALADSNQEISQYLSSVRYPINSQAKLYLVKVFAESNFSVWPDKPVLGNSKDHPYSNFFNHLPAEPASIAVIPLMRRHQCLGTLNLGSLNAHTFSPNMATDFVEHIAAIIAICLENCINFETMRRSSMADPLTGINNRRFLEQRIDEELDRCQRSREALSCLFLDIDFFKHINDNFGHQAGDQVLTSVAGAIRRQLRSNDVLARYGGEEFVALLYQSNNNIAELIAERIRIAVANLPITHQEAIIQVNLSIGIATFQPDFAQLDGKQSISSQLIQSADAALYQAKRNGRNRVENHGIIGQAN